MRFGDFFQIQLIKTPELWKPFSFRRMRLPNVMSSSWDTEFSWDSVFSVKKTRLLIKVDDEYIIKIIAMTIDSFKFWQKFFLLRQQSGRVKRHAYSYVFLLRPPLPKARSRGGRQFFYRLYFMTYNVKGHKYVTKWKDSSKPIFD